MRNNLANHLGKYVHCSGHIATWEDLEGLPTRRVVVSYPTIKKPNKDLLFKDQTTISKEHHLNLFIRHEDIPLYDTIFEIHQPINFSGVIQHYSRSDGSWDYGIYPTKQSTIDFEIRKLTLSINQTVEEEGLKGATFVEEYAIRKLEEMMIELENCGDRLPTFRQNYSFYRS